MAFEPKRTIPIIQHNAVTEEYRRSDALPFKLSSELASMGWSGIRQNPVTSDVEIWVAGEIKETIPESTVKIDSKAIEKAHMRVFALGPENAPDGLH